MKPGYVEVPTPCGATCDLEISEEVSQSVGDVLSMVGDKWSLLVVHRLSRGGLRFSELRRELGPISKKVLAATLRGLERDGYLSRTVTPSVPPRVDYELTRLGQEVLTPVTALATWAMANRPEVEAARTRFDRRR